MVSLGAKDVPGRFDPDNLAGLDPAMQEMVRRRQNVLGPGYMLLYNQPVGFVRGSGAHLFDADGNDYLDAYNNVPSVGHCHPHVAEAIAKQAATLNTNTRYAQAPLVDYAERLISYFPAELQRVTFACSGSEANDLAMRVARHYTGNAGFIISEHAYHGLTREVSTISPTLGAGSPLGANVRTVTPPNPAQVPTGSTLKEHMVSEIRRAIFDLQRHGFELAALIFDLSFMSDGIFVNETGWLQAVIDEVHAAGGIFIADEVQAGFARLGSAMWGFRHQGVVPDIVTMGKPMGNGIPLSGAVFRPEVAQDFGEKVRYFNTFGGSSVPIAAGAAVLDVFEQEQVPARVDRIGKLLRDGVRELLADSPHVAEVRGEGLVLAVEIVTDRTTRTPDRERTSAVINAMRERRVLISGAGKHVNVLKVRPPLAFNEADVTRLLETLAAVAKLHLS